MAARWSVDTVLALAPDESSRRAATGLVQPRPWSGTGTTDGAVWGLCSGSGRNPYQTVVDLDGPAYKCSCPSRKFPCKHALALLLLWSGGSVPGEAEPADYAKEWLAGRRTKAQPAGESATGESATGVKDEAGAAKRAAERDRRVAGGLAELAEWLRDQVRAGLAASASQPGHAAAVAARMVDAQAKGVAGALRGVSDIPASGDGWPGRLLSEYAMLHLLARAGQRLDALPAGLAATVRSRIGYTTARREVLTAPAVTDHWDVLAVRELTDGDVPGRRIWLRGRDTGRHAMLLTFAGNGVWQDPDTAKLRPGTLLHADLHFYPGQPPLRALTGTRHGAPERAKPPAPDGGIDALLSGYAAGLEQDPWLTVWPALLDGTPVSPGDGRTSWHFADQSGAAVPIVEQESLWTLLATSGGHQVTVAGEWQPDGLLPLTVWLDDHAVRL
jgi:SWIM zinc finger